MNTSSDSQKDPNVAGEVDATTNTNTSVAATMTTTNVASASEAPSTSAVEKPLTDLDVSEQREGGATIDSKLVAKEEFKSDGKPESIQTISLSGRVNVKGWADPTTQGDLNGQVTVTGKTNLNGLDDLNGLANLGGLVKVAGDASIDGQVVVGLPDTVSPRCGCSRPRAKTKIRKLESLQELAMDRRRGLIQHSDESLEEMKKRAKETEQEFQRFLANAQDVGLCPSDLSAA